MEEMKRVKVMHPTSGNVVDVDMPVDMTIQELIDDLIDSHFVNEIPDGYTAALKDGVDITNMDLDKTLEENGGGEYSTIRLFSGAMA
ncbi:MAG: hypothetical protein SOY73_10170 [Blautia sp.]|nr:hypothetical protein [Blautia sp.]MDY3999438.1 hypothetical protein [Blautia sp.]